VTNLKDLPAGFLPDPLRGSPLARMPLAGATARVFLDRACETAGFGEPTQDYLVLRHDATRVCFAVTDGVSASFMGEIAAQALAVGLVEWLGESSSALDEEEFRAALLRQLDVLAEATREKVAAFPVPESVSGLMLEVLEEKRGYGSEAMFVCGSVDIGQQRRLARFAWLGDAHLRLTGRDGHTDHLTGATAERWSTRLGARGTVGHKFCLADQVSRVIAYSDGLLPEVDSVVALPDTRLKDRLSALARTADSDDIALIDLAFARGAMPGKGFPPLRDMIAGLFRRRAER